MKKKVVFYISALKGGGAERTLVNIINNLNRDMFEVTLIVTSRINNEYMGLLSRDVKVKYVECNRIRYCLLKIKRAVYEEEPDLIFSTIASNNIIMLLTRLLSFKKTPVIVREASNRTESGNVSFINKLLTCFLYNFIATKVIALSEGVKQDLISNFFIKKDKIQVIYNPIEVHKIKQLSEDKITDLKEIENHKRIIAVGRLAIQKDFKTLIQAFSLVVKEENAKLYILGQGPERENLINLTKELGLEKRVIFLGFKKNPYKYMRISDIFVLSSLWEGFGHVIAEAMAVGIPVIATNCKSGPAEIITDNKNGTLVPVNDPKVMAEKIIELLKSVDQMEKYTINGCKRVKDFDAKKIINEYEETFKSVMNK